MLKFKTIEKNLWFSSDIHAYHKNITRGVSRWDRNNLEDSTRDFATTPEMTDHMINAINDSMKWDDHLFLLGDLLFHRKTIDDYVSLLDRFLCDNIYLLIGNHDNRDDIIRLTHHKVKFIGDYLEIDVNKQLVCMSHYPMEKWNTRHGSSYMLHGHEHGNLKRLRGSKRMDVGIDNYFKLFKEYKPFSFNEVEKILND